MLELTRAGEMYAKSSIETRRERRHQTAMQFMKKYPHVVAYHGVFFSRERYGVELQREINSTTRHEVAIPKYGLLHAVKQYCALHKSPLTLL